MLPHRSAQNRPSDRWPWTGTRAAIPSSLSLRRWKVRGNSSDGAPFRVALWQMERDSELRALETLARDGIRLIKAQQLVFAHLARSLTNQVGSLSRAATDRTINVVSDSNHLVAENFAKVTVRCMRSRRQNIARALSFSDTRGCWQPLWALTSLGGSGPSSMLINRPIRRLPKKPKSF